MGGLAGEQGQVRVSFADLAIPAMGTGALPSLGAGRTAAGSRIGHRGWEQNWAPKPAEVGGCLPHGGNSVGHQKEPGGKGGRRRCCKEIRSRGIIRAG